MGHTEDPNANVAGSSGGLFYPSSNAVLPMLLPASMFGSGVNGTRVLQTAAILLIEITGNVLVYAALFAIAVAAVAAVRRTIVGRKG